MHTILDLLITFFSYVAIGFIGAFIGIWLAR